MLAINEEWVNRWLLSPVIEGQMSGRRWRNYFAAPPIAGSKSTGVSLLSFEDSRSSPLPLACSNCPLMQLIAPQREVHHIAGGEPRVVASRRDRRAPPMGGIRRERRGGGHRRGWRDDWSCRGRAGRRLGVASEQAAAVVVLLEISPIFFGGRSSQNLWARFLSAFSWEGLLARPVGCKYLT